MRCPSCELELTQMSLTGGILRVSCRDCQIYFLEVVDVSATTQDLLNVLHQVVRKEPQ